MNMQLQRAHTAAADVRPTTLTDRLGDRAHALTTQTHEFADQIAHGVQQAQRIVERLFGTDCVTQAIRESERGSEAGEPPVEFQDHAFTDAAFSVADIAEQRTRHRQEQMTRLNRLLAWIDEALVHGPTPPANVQERY